MCYTLYDIRYTLYVIAYSPLNRGWLVPSLSRERRSHRRPAAAAGRMVCDAKRIRSIYLPSPTGRPRGLSTTTPPKAPASLSTINAATMRLCGADHPAAPRHPAVSLDGDHNLVGFGPPAILGIVGCDAVEEAPFPRKVLIHILERRGSPFGGNRPYLFEVSRASGTEILLRLAPFDDEPGNPGALGGRGGPFLPQAAGARARTQSSTKRPTRRTVSAPFLFQFLLRQGDRLFHLHRGGSPRRAPAVNRVSRGQTRGEILLEEL